MNFLIAFFIVILLSNLLLLSKMIYYRKITLMDEHTGIHNFRYLKSFLGKKSKNNQLSLVLLDINNFKEFNSISIHKGDEVLKEFADELKNFLSGEVVFCRYRLGDEFALVFRNRTIEEIIVEVNLISAYFNNYSFRCLDDNHQYRISFCFGVSEIKAAHYISDNLFEVAESELAAAKLKKAWKQEF